MYLFSFAEPQLAAFCAEGAVSLGIPFQVGTYMPPSTLPTTYCRSPPVTLHGFVLPHDHCLCASLYACLSLPHDVLPVCACIHTLSRLQHTAFPSLAVSLRYLGCSRLRGSIPPPTAPPFHHLQFGTLPPHTQFYIPTTLHTDNVLPTTLQFITINANASREQWRSGVLPAAACLPPLLHTPAAATTTTCRRLHRLPVPPHPFLPAGWRGAILSARTSVVGLLVEFHAAPRLVHVPTTAWRTGSG